MIFKVICNVAAEGLIEPEVANMLAPELRPMLLLSNAPHSWRYYFSIEADSPEAALQFFKKTFAEKIGDYRVVTADEIVEPE